MVIGDGGKIMGPDDIVWASRKVGIDPATHGWKMCFNTDSHGKGGAG